MTEKNALKITFWGVRGSYPQCKTSHEKTGGHTSCVSLEVNDQYLIFDAGTGIIDAGNDILKQGLKKATLLISHAHADHISGLAFFGPLHCPDFELTIISSGLIEPALTKFISPPFFPLPWNKTASRKIYIDSSPTTPLPMNNLLISTTALDHPGGSAGYRIDVNNKSICYITDTAHTPGTLNQSLIEFIRHTDMMIYDATFTEEEFAAKPTWGHSTWNQAVALAKAASIRDLALFHHNPDHDDAFMDALESEAQEHFSRAFVTRQGMIRIL